MSLPPMDPYQRRIDYLRISITDRCNLRCAYCMPEEDFPHLKHEDILRYEEILRFAGIVAQMGITKIRITGGEPLVRKDALFLCENIARIPEVESLSITTNGVLLSRYAESLFRAGVKRINVSLDTLRPERFAAITRSDLFHEVWQGILKALKTGFTPVKLNVVVMQGVNDDEIEDLGRLIYEYPIHVRFIEFMPFKSDEHYTRFLSAEAILERLSAVSPLISVKSRHSNGPARHFSFEGAKGKIGIISPVSNHFCPSCNRLRVTADGKLRACLFSSEETDIRTPLRSHASDGEIMAIIQNAIDHKPEKHELESTVFRNCISRPMVSIGG